MQRILRKVHLFFGPCALVGLLFSASSAANRTDEQLLKFREPPPESRTRVYWRIFGPAWTPPEIDYQLGLLKEAGVGGVMTYFFYPVAVDGPEIHNQEFLSDEFLKTLRYAANKAHALGLRFGVSGGTGWPYGGPSVSTADSAQQLRQVTVTAPGSGDILPKLRAGEQILAVFSGTNDVTARVLAKSGWPGPEPREPLHFYITGPTRMQVKRPAFGGEGLVVDHYSRAAAERFLNSAVAPLLDAAPGFIESVFCDSLEVYRANWTPDLPEVFQKARGRPLVPLLPDIFDSNRPGSPAARFDFWRTLSEQTEVGFTRTLSEWAHKRAIKLEMEAYGTPPNPLSAARFIDVPTGEQYEWKGFSLTRLAASGAHLCGKRIIGMEAWTWLGLPNRLGDSLSDAKLCSDLHFLGGANDLTAVDFAYSPRSVGAPGWLPYYGPVFNQNNPQWPWFKDLVSYASRCQWLLRQGKPVADVALYLPVEDQFAFGPVDQMLLGFRLRDHFVSGRKTSEFGLQKALEHRSDLIESLFQQGFNFDGIDFFSLNRLARIKRGHLLAGDGDYKILILPRVIGLEVDALRKILEFARAGGTVLMTGRVPERLFGTVSNDGTKLLADLTGAEHGNQWTRKYGQGQLIFVEDEKESLSRKLREFRPDLLLEPIQPEVGFVHRQTDSEDIYFLANTSEKVCTFTGNFRSKQRGVEAWNPMTGQAHGLPFSQTQAGGARVELELPPRGSMFVVFGHHPNSQPIPALSWQSEELPLVWHLSFNGSNAPPSQTLSNLDSWTNVPEARFYSGTGTYSGEFSWKHARARQVKLIFSQVCEAASVQVNGKDAGVVWTPPYEVDITDVLKPGTNSLSITVANSQLNLFLGTPDQDLSELRRRYGDRFPSPQEKQVHPEPKPSGLIGPVQLRFALD